MSKSTVNINLSERGGRERIKKDSPSLRSAGHSDSEVLDVHSGPSQTYKADGVSVEGALGDEGGRRKEKACARGDSQQQSRGRQRQVG